MIGSVHVSLGAMRRNAQTLQQLVGPKTAAAFVVKSNAYGHGLVESALAVEPLSHRLCVYALDEALALRDGGITAPIVVLGPIEPERLDDALAAGVELALWDTKSFLRDLVAASHQRHTRARVHVKVNTGLNRLGIEPHDVADAVEDYARVSHLEITGIFSHLAAAEEIDSPYTNYQLERFKEACVQAAPVFASSGIEPIRHIAASAAAMMWPQARLDMMRAGIALYGLWPSEATKLAMNGDAIDLEPALTYTSSLVTTRDVPAGAAIGYGNTFHAPRAMRLGVVPLGYSDGIPRLLSNRGAFIVEGARCPIIGRIAMNMTVVDLTHAPRAHAGSIVTLIGRDGDATVSADDWATWAETINYEIVSRLPSELTRVYSED